jgi:hypothetical protein
MDEHVTGPAFHEKNQCPRAALYPAALSRVGFAILRGPQGYLYSVALLVPDQRQHSAAMAWLDESRPSILFVLGIKCLWSALRATLARARAFFRIRRHLQ